MAAENNETVEKSEKKKMSRLRAFLFNRQSVKEFEKESQLLNSDSLEKADKHAKDTRKLNEYLSAIENQLDKVDEQNKILLMHLSTVKENNEVLLDQIKVLSKNNELLFKQFQASKLREKWAKIIAIISSCLAIGFWIYRFVMMIVSG